ncbi:unnamed protein product [Strongylus vulgaris]|uniref:Adenosine deaminase domain-containing protein n=1 Tax=Strongylus vulgaris TaxID=40348 RepID=A0A3P7KN45_STRVU|nr:unnamed protein product [Strongylus vulgaris]
MASHCGYVEGSSNNPQSEFSVWKLGDFSGSGLIVGIELSGDPAIDGRKFLPVLKQARRAGLKVSIHLAEISNQLDEVEEFLRFRPDRIGHGTFLHTRSEFINLMIQHRIPLEICLTSNVMSMTTSSIADSHLKFWRERSIPICLCVSFA